MGQQRRSWSVEEKRAIVLAVLSEGRSVEEVARQQGVNENQVYRSKEPFLEGVCLPRVKRREEPNQPTNSWKRRITR